LNDARYLLDVNVMVALTECEHSHHTRAVQWFRSPGLQFALCPLSEAGFLRIATNPHVGAHTFDEASAVLDTLGHHPGYRFWPISVGWSDIVQTFRQRILGHRQITDAYLLGLAIKRNGILVSLDKGIGFLAGQKYSRNVLILE
jgi:toxin-antitoxin system PIN domain toxin